LIQIGRVILADEIFFMKRVNLLLIAILLVGQNLLAQNNNYGITDFRSLDAILGTWKMETRRGPMFEQWTSVNNEKFQGKSFRLNNQDTLVMERIELSISGGSIVYSPIATGQNDGKAVEFKLISNTGNRFVFENKEHDYPQRIIYHFKSKDTLNARIEGTKDGKEMGSNFPYVRLR